MKNKHAPKCNQDFEEGDSADLLESLVANERISYTPASMIYK